MKSNIIKYIFLIFVIGLIIFACYTVYKDEKNKKVEPTETQSPIEQNISNDIRLSIVGYDTINPILSNNRNVQEISKLLYEPLLTLDKNYKPKECLAQEWSKTGENSYIVKIKQNLKWQDGTKITADDVQFTIDRLKDTQSIYTYNIINIANTEIIDNYTIKINLNSNISFFEYNLTFPILSKTYYEGEDFKNTTKNLNPLASGKYKIESNNENTIILKKNQNYWNILEEDTKIENIIINLYSSMGEAYNNFKLGNIDLLTTQNTQIEQYIGTIGYNKKDYIGREHDFIAMNCNNSILGRPEVRKAVAYTIDKSGIIASVFDGKYYTANFPIDCGFWCYNSENGSAGYNPDQARQILIDNGWQYKYGNWQKVENYRTIRLTLDIIVNSENDIQIAVAEGIKNNLANIGINLKINKVSYLRYNEYLENKNYNMILTGTTIGLNPDLSTYMAEDNLANYKNEESIAIINELKNVVDDGKTKDNIKRLSEIYLSDFPYISLYFNKNTMLYSTRLIGDIEPNCYNIFYGIENWYRTY